MVDDGLSAFAATEEGPTAVVFGTFNYRRTVWRWIKAARRASVNGWRIVCMELELVAWLERRGEGARALYYYDLVRDVPRQDFAVLDRTAVRRALWPLRTRLFLHLANAGCDFVHSDADAFWKRDPRRYLAEHPEFDLLISQGTWFPLQFHRQFGFVLCAGFFLCRSNAQTRRYFERVQALESSNGDDQWRMNIVLLRDPESRWEVRDPVSRRSVCRRVSDGEGRWRWARSLTRKVSSRLPWVGVRSFQPGPAVLRDERSCVVLTSKAVIRGEFSGGLTVGVIPMHLVTRRRVTRRCESLVVH